MADASTAKLSEPHTPKSASIEAFKNAFPDIKNEFHKTRHQWDEHEPEMFARVQHHTDHELLENVNLDKDLVQVRTGESAYGLHLFGKIKLQKVDDAYIHVRLFVTDAVAKFHAIETKESVKGETKTVNAIFHEKDPLEWFPE